MFKLTNALNLPVRGETTTITLPEIPPKDEYEYEDEDINTEGEKNHECRKCGQTFDSPSKLKRHLSLSHYRSHIQEHFPKSFKKFKVVIILYNNMVDFFFIFKCELCGCKLTSKQGMLNHIGGAHDIVQLMEEELVKPEIKAKSFQGPNVGVYASVAPSKTPPTDLSQAEKAAHNKETKGRQDHRKEELAKPKIKAKSFQGSKGVNASIASPTLEHAQAEKEAKKNEKQEQEYADNEDHREVMSAKPKIKAKSFQGPNGGVNGSVAPSKTPPTDLSQAEKAAHNKETKGRQDHRKEELAKPKIKAKSFQGPEDVIASIMPGVIASIIQSKTPTASPTLVPAQSEKSIKKNEAKGDQMHADIEDHKEKEELVQPKIKAKSFQGPTSAKERVDRGKQVATIQVRLTDGTPLIVKLSHEQTVADLRMYINVARPQYEGVNYALITTFPTKELTDDSITIASAGLVGASVLLRL